MKSNRKVNKFRKLIRKIYHHKLFKKMENFFIFLIKLQIDHLKPMLLIYLCDNIYKKIYI